MQVYICDVCGSRECKSYSFAVDRKLDAAGSSDDVCHTFELCDKHYADVLKEAIYQVYPDPDGEHVINRIIVEKIKKKQRAKKENNHGF